MTHSTSSGAASSRALGTVLRRLHFCIGLFVGPFLLVAALSGVLYALTPQLEELIYEDALHASTHGAPLAIAEQVRLARQYLGADAPVFAVRPSPAPGDTTRIMFRDDKSAPSESRALFIDPVSGEIRGDMTVYGTSGVLPLRTWLDQFHRGLLLGDLGRLYSELAASWLWVAALGGVYLWSRRRRSKGLLAWHSQAGLWLMLGLLFFSATGLTWSQYAGGNIGVLRAWYGWGTPSVSTQLHSSMASRGMNDEHAEHHMSMPMDMPTMPMEDGIFDRVLSVARAAGIQSAHIEIKPAAKPGQAWTVTEIDRRWPTHVDAVAIDPTNLQVTDHAVFSDYPMAAKLTRWGIDAHMGALFGLPNQLLLIVVGIGLVVMVCLGYAMWRKRRPTRGLQPSLMAAWRELSPLARGISLLASLALGVALPVLGGSLVLLLAIDALLGLRTANIALDNEQA
ncbi:PepSY-associated TM helix domain-containing protein [Pseudomonas sp. PDM22]|uniref:PepSY-associated TM helix domain-containing protein n=1 Tax=Pseudomonas sp. PDM22 TaxID=2769287 RepID=UPI00177DBF4D|nr:PepSY-associated TM helix domain-containing protein [Pseudomonas sp. PDM22]MBD9513662.1 PepSY domain-containing protein [Pseudomonas sp. PDM22]